MIITAIRRNRIRRVVDITPSAIFTARGKHLEVISVPPSIFSTRVKQNMLTLTAPPLPPPPPLPPTVTTHRVRHRAGKRKRDDNNDDGGGGRDFYYVCPFHSSCFPKPESFSEKRGGGKRILPDMSQNYEDYFGGSTYRKRVASETLVTRKGGTNYNKGLYSSRDALFKHIKAAGHGTTFGSTEETSYACYLSVGNTECNGTAFTDWRSFRTHIKDHHVDASEAGFFSYTESPLSSPSSSPPTPQKPPRPNSFGHITKYDDDDDEEEEDESGEAISESKTETELEEPVPPVEEPATTRVAITEVDSNWAVLNMEEWESGLEWTNLSRMFRADAVHLKSYPKYALKDVLEEDSFIYVG